MIIICLLAALRIYRRILRITDFCFRFSIDFDRKYKIEKGGRWKTIFRHEYTLKFVECILRELMDRGKERKSEGKTVRRI